MDQHVLKFYGKLMMLRDHRHFSVLFYFYIKSKFSVHIFLSLLSILSSIVPNQMLHIQISFFPSIPVKIMTNNIAGFL